MLSKQRTLFEVGCSTTVCHLGPFVLGRCTHHKLYLGHLKNKNKCEQTTSPHRGKLC